MPISKSNDGKNETPTGTARTGLLYVCVAVMFFATSPVLIRWAQPFSSIEVAFWRLAIAAGLVAVLGLITRQPLVLQREYYPRFVLYGLITALHFFFYNAALSYTTAAHALALVYTSPIWIALLSTIVLKENLAARKYAGIGVAIVGIAILASFEPNYTACTLSTGRCMILGDGLALLSALCLALYSIAGRGERDRHPLFRYTTNVYGFAALWLLPLVAYLAFQHQYTLPAMASVLALGIVPLGLGHTLYNAAIRRIPATYANLIATQEVTTGVLLSAIFLHEIPSINTFIGGVIALIGIVSVLL
jgi:drug/metabolite transporter (DMT)-like permease